VRLAAKHDEIVAALETLTGVIPELQVYGYRNPNPTTPSLDLYPAPTFQTGAAFGVTEKQVVYVVRARVAQNDPEAAQRVLLRLLDPDDTASVEAALAGADAVVGNTQNVTGFQDDVDGMLSCTWEAGVFI
jgi:hypothetical protein